MVKELQQRRYGIISNVMLDKNPDFIKLCEAYGIPGIRVSNNSEIEAALDKAIESKGPFLIECKVDSDESTL